MHFALAPALLLFGTALAIGPEKALAYREPALPAALQELERARAELRRAELGLSAGLEIEPALDYGGSLGDPDGTELELGLDIGLDLGFRYDRPDILREAIDLVQAEERVRDARRGGVEAALNAHGGLLRAQLALRTTGRELEEAEEELAAMRARSDVGKTELEGVRLELEESRRERVEAESILQVARARARHFGLASPAEFEALTFALPAAMVQESFDYRQLELEAALAEAVGLQDSVYAVLEDVRVEAAFEGTNYRLDAALSLDRGRPGMELGATYNQTDDDDWEIGVAATLRLDDETLAGFTEADQEVEAARQELAAFGRLFALDAAEARFIAVSAQREVDLSQRKLELARRRLAQARARQEALSAQLATARTRPAEAGEMRRLERALERARSEAEDATRDRDAAEDALYIDWLDYIELAGDYLQLIDGRWEVVPPTSGDSGARLRAAA